MESTPIILKAIEHLHKLLTESIVGTGAFPALPGPALNLSFNWSLIRFSDVLLMFAEAENEINNGPTAAAISAFEEVRKRVFKGNESRISTTPATKAGFFNAVVDERYLEFAGKASVNLILSAGPACCKDGPHKPVK